MLENQFVPQESESKIYEFWLKHDLFKADPHSKAPTYTIVFPPPNVTGVLHMGHALTCTLEDILIRRKRMQGFNTLWIPGTDHAGIATQMVVERNLMKEEKKSRHDLGREKFLEKVWEWKEKSQETILSQMKKMGGSFDWTRIAFTLDESVSLAVKECFLRLYNEGLIYRDTAIIQWCPRCHTALSDLEVKFKETPGKFWHIKYRLKGDPSKYVVVATTRPETLLGDTAVAVHPEDTRFSGFLGQEVMVPLVGRAIPLITDSYVDPQFGTGALKITPGHDPNDYVVGKRHNLPIINLMDENAILNSEAGPYQGLDRVKARAKVLEDLVKQDLLIKEEDHSHNVGHCDRCGTVVEPRVSQQWFVKAEELAKEAIRAVETKEIRIVPEEWEKTYFEWMRNIRPWCISRQLWWGHR
ncbi:MAG: valine--tRNA ligase, partial [Deltaproteobacteria bacterium]